MTLAPAPIRSTEPVKARLSRSRLDSGDLPIAALAALAEREARHPNPIYGAHRWFARRLGTAMRALLVASATETDSDFWAAFDGEADLRGVRVADPFMGGGTSLVEALRLGASVDGNDIDPVACAVSSFQLEAAQMPDLKSGLDDLKASVGSLVRPLHTIRGPSGEAREVVHWFWVQVVACASCGVEAEAQPHFRLAVDTDAGHQTVFCRSCHAIEDLPKAAGEFDCRRCATRTVIAAAPVARGKFTCPGCGATERLIDVAKRTGAPPTWRLFASESIPAGASVRQSTLAHRVFLPVTAEDLALYAQAQAQLLDRTGDGGAIRGLPNDELPDGARTDDRLRRYGYDRATDLFNDRQLLHLSLLAEALSSRSAPERRTLGMAFSDHLTTNCMLTGYAFGWRRLSPLFAIRGYRHMVRPVEVNPWLDGIGRGTYPNAVRQVQRAIDEARAPRTLSRTGAFTALPSRPAAAPRVRCADARNLGHIPDGSVDLVLTDPPYLDNVAYSELADFYRPWLRLAGLLPEPVGTGGTLAVHGRGAEAQDRFEAGLRHVMTEIERVLALGGRVTFTFRHESEGAYRSLAAAIGAAGLTAVTVFPMKGDGSFGLHYHDGSTTWDAVFVLARGLRPNGDADRDRRDAQRHVTAWMSKLRAENLILGAADEAAFGRAAMAAASLGAFSQTHSASEEAQVLG